MVPKNCRVKLSSALGSVSQSTVLVGHARHGLPPALSRPPHPQFPLVELMSPPHVEQAMLLNKLTNGRLNLRRLRFLLGGDEKFLHPRANLGLLGREPLPE